MNLILPLVENIALLAIPALVYIALPRFEEGWPEGVRAVLLGLALGGTSATVMLIPIEIQPGVIVDARGAPVLLSAIIGGPITALVAVIPPILMRASIGGMGMVPGVASLILYGLMSVVAWYGFRRLGRRWGFWTLLLFAAVATLVSIPVVFLLPDIDVALALIKTVTPILLVSNVCGSAILGSLIAVETKRLALMTSLQESEAAAQRALEIRTRFIATMSHELRTPLNAVLGYAQLLNDNTLTEKQVDRLSRLSSAADALLHLIDDILQFSSIQTGKLTITPETVDLRSTLNGAINLVRRDADLKGLDLTCNTDALPSVRVHVDGPRLQQVLANVLSNAIKFTDTGSVAMTARLGDGRVRIAVSDTGIGIPADQIEKVFQPFERIAESTAPGTGLGMAIVRAIIDAMGGEILIDSEPGSGTTVTIDVPATTREEADEPAPSVEGVCKCVPAKQPCNILVVDDIAINADIAKAMLEDAGCQVIVAEDGAKAVAAVRERAFDAVIMDIQMPVMDGLEATRTVRAPGMPDHARSVPIIALTAYASRSDLHTCLDAGMNGYLTKPVDRTALCDALAKVGVFKVIDATERPTAIAKPQVTVLDASRLEQLKALVPADTLATVIREARVQIEAFGVEITRSSVEDTERRQALHKVVSIAGNLGLIELSNLSRQQHDTLRDGGSLSGDDVERYRGSIERALAELDRLAETEPTAA